MGNSSEVSSCSLTVDGRLFRVGAPPEVIDMFF